MSTNDELFEECEAKIGSNPDHYSGHEYGRFIELRDQLEIEGNHDGAALMQKGAEAFMFGTRIEDEKKGPYFVPMVGMGDEEGPPWANMTPETIDFYRERAGKAKNRFARARYADIVWEKTRDHIMGRTAFEDYGELVPETLRRRWHRQVRELLIRRLHIAVVLNDQNRIAEALASIRETIDTLHNEANYEATLQVADALARVPKKHTSPDLFEWALARNLEAAEHFGSLGGDHRWSERGHLESAASLRRNIGQDDTDLRRRVAESFACNAAEHDKTLVASSLYSDAIRRFADLGDRETVARLQLKLRELGPTLDRDFGVVESEVSIPTEKVEVYIESFIADDVDESLQRISIGFRPNVAETIKQAQEMKEKTPLQFMIPQQILAEDGRVVAQATSEDEIFHLHVLRTIRLGFQLNAIFISNVLAKLRSERGLTPDGLTDFLCSSPVIGPERREFVEHAMKLYFARDWVSAIHVLVPQLEHILRSILPRIGVPPEYTDDHGIMRVHLLDRVLRSDEVRAAFGDDIWHYFYTFLADQEGENYRNRVAHGVIPWEQCGEVPATILVHLLLTLTTFRFEAHEPSTTETERGEPATE